MAVVVLLNNDKEEINRFEIDGEDNIDILYKAEKMLVELWSHREYTGGGMKLIGDMSVRDMFFACDEKTEDHFRLCVIND